MNPSSNPASSFKSGSFNRQKASPEELQSLSFQKKNGSAVEVKPKGSAAASAAAAVPVGGLTPSLMLRRGAQQGDLDKIRKAHSLGVDLNEPDTGEAPPEDEDKKDENNEEKKDEKEEEKKEESGSDSDSEEEDDGGDEEEKEMKRKAMAVYSLNSRDTALHYAAQHGHVEAVQLLMELMADIEAKNKLGSTPLHRAVSYQRVEVVEKLLRWKANVSAPNNVGNTPLHVACYLGNERLAEMLITAGAAADILRKNRPGMSPWDYCNNQMKAFLRRQFPDLIRVFEAQHAQQEERKERDGL
eukprot:TRINITY_DN2823_c0_g1_i4.p1 TRINITY_DN2823_c0_g1~~TRINITY_DN2823_c0_g1_i4.p1  ORF type:complete len:300 (+),score=103.65 TRINITY_DN2823_c0_g1_i4:92-991(+)